MRWVYDNRRVLPGILDDAMLYPGLHAEPPLEGLEDGLHLLAEVHALFDWERELNLSVRVHREVIASPTLSLLIKLTGGNCFLFESGCCETLFSVGSEETGKQITPRRAIECLKELI